MVRNTYILKYSFRLKLNATPVLLFVNVPDYIIYVRTLAFVMQY